MHAQPAMVNIYQIFIKHLHVFLASEILSIHLSVFNCLLICIFVNMLSNLMYRRYKIDASKVYQFLYLYFRHEMFSNELSICFSLSTHLHIHKQRIRNQDLSKSIKYLPVCPPSVFLIP